MTLSRRILVGLASGVVAGLFLGELAAPLGVVADGFVKLLQMTVLPYVTVSIVSSLGSLDLAQAKRLGRRVGAVIAGLWVVALSFALLFPLVFPAAETASFFTASLLEKPAPFDLVSLYVPSNPFHSLANNIVPGVVVFSVVLGVALIGVERKAVLLDVLSVLGTAIARVTRFVVGLTPYGVFALAAHAAGTLELDQLRQIQVYLITYIAFSLLLSLWVLPGLVAALTPIRHRELLAETRDALITAFAAADLFIVLPMLIESCKKLLSRHALGDARNTALPDVIAPASFNFPHTGKLLSLSFIPFAAWLAGAALPASEYPQLALTGLLTFFGSLNAAVPFLLDLFRIPADTFQLFVATSVINARFGTLTAAVHTVVVSLLGSAAATGALRFEARRVLRYAVTAAALSAALVLGLRVSFRTLLGQEFKGRERVYGMTNAVAGTLEGRVVEPWTAAAPLGRPVLEAVRERGVLRVGFVAERPPFVFENGAKQLVGFDAELAQLLARDLGVALELAPWPPGELQDAVAKGAADVGIGGIAVTPELAARALVSQPYLDETLAFVVKDHLRGRFETWAEIQAASDLTIGVPPLPYYERLLRARLPQLTLKTLAPGQPLLDPRAGLDAIAFPAERGSVLTLLHPEWTVVIPQPGVVKLPLVFVLPRHDLAWAGFVSTWIQLKRRDGTIDALYEHWILGKRAGKRSPRWSIARDVLHWVGEPKPPR